MRIHHDITSLRYKTPFGCVRQEEACTLRVEIPKHCEATGIFLVLEQEDGTPYKRLSLTCEEHTAEYETYRLTFQMKERGLYFYYFDIITTQSSFTLFREGLHQTSMSYGDKWQVTCYDKQYDTPEAFRGKVMYQVFPDRFFQSGNCDLTGKLEPYSIHAHKSDVPIYYPDQNGVVQNNDFFGGNLRGILEKLPYLTSLQVKILYLNPIFMAYSNHRYDTADYLRIDPMLGTEDDLKELCERAHLLGMKVLVDGVFSHTGCNSVYFDKYRVFGGGAYHDPDSPYRGWYQFFPHNPKEYTSWWGIETLPCVEEMNDEFLNFIIRDDDSVIAHWMRLGVDGYRLDVADELPDEFIRMLHERVHAEKPEALVLGEVWEDASNKIAYSVRRRYFVDNELDSVMNYPYKDAIIGFIQGNLSSEALADTVMRIADHYPKPVLDCLMNSLSTHDTMRILTVLGAEDFSLSRAEKAYASLAPHQLERGIRKLKAAMFLQFFLPGCPCIYYGDEVGLEGYEDPFNRRYFPWDHQNEDLLEYTRQLAEIKTRYQALATGSIRVLCEADGVFAFSRELEGQTLIGIVSMRGSYPCFTSHRPLLSHNAEILEHQILLHKHGCVLLEVDKCCR